MKLKRNYSISLVLLIFSLSLLITLSNISPIAESGEKYWESTPIVETHHYPGHLSNETNLLWFVQITDVHINSFEKIFGVQSELLRQALNDIKNYIKPSFIIDTGDLVNGLNPLPYHQNPQQWMIRYKVLQDTQMNSSFYYDLVGNHDGYGNSDNFSYFLNWSIQKKLQYTFNRSIGNSNYTFIVLNSVWSNGAEWPDGTSGELNTSELDWFESQLIKNKNSNLTFVFQHHPYTDVGNFTTTTGKSFIDLLEEYNVTADIFGHGHEDLELNQGGTICIETGTLGQGDKSIRIFAIDNDGVSTKVGVLNNWPIAMITTPMDRDLTRTAYDIPNSSKSAPIRAIVFDKKPIIKVEFNIDNGPWYNLTNSPLIKPLWNGSFNPSTLSNGIHHVNLRAISESGISTDSVTIFIGISKKPEIINGKIKDVIRYSDAGPLRYDLSMYKWDKVDSNKLLKWNLSNVDPSFCKVQIIDNDTLLFTPNPSASGTKSIIITLNDTAGYYTSQVIHITLLSRFNSNLLVFFVTILELIIVPISFLLGIFWYKLSKFNIFKKSKKQK